MEIYKVINTKTDKDEDFYVGRWYESQCFPQKVYFFLNHEHGVSISYNAVIGKGVSSYVWHGQTLMLELPLNLYSDSECETIVKDTEEICEQLCDSYYEKWNGNNYIGHYDESLIEKLESILENYTESVLDWREIDENEEE